MIRIAFVAIAAATAAMPSSASAAEGITKYGSHAATYWQQAASTEADAVASLAEAWQFKTANAYFSVYSYYCAPDFYERAATPGQPDGIEVAIYTGTLRVDYTGDCRAFFFGEIAPRLGLSGIETPRSDMAVAADDFMPIHMKNQQIGSAVQTYWQTVANVAAPSLDGFMSIHLDNQKITSAVTAYWRSLSTSGDETISATAED